MKQNLFLKQWRLFRGLTVQKLAEFSGWSPGYISEVENGRKRQYSPQFLDNIASALNTSPLEIQTQDPTQADYRLGIPVKGYVAANGDSHFVSNYDVGDGEEFISQILSDADIAVKVSGQSMMPRYRPGDVIVLGFQTNDPSHYIHKDVVAQISGTEQKVLKTLKHGRDGTWTLKSINPAFDDIPDQHLDWVAPVVWVKV